MFHVLMSPLGLGCLVLALSWLARRRGKRGITLVCNAVLVLCLLLMTPLGANVLIRAIEGLDPQPGNCTLDASRQVVLLTGGATRRPVSPTDFAALTPESSSRLFDLLASGQLQADRSVLISGGGQGVSEAAVVQQLAIRLGVQESRIRTEERSTSTWENARRVAEMRPPVSRRIVLVTSALHMDRAVYSFASQGFDVCRFPVNSVYVPPGGIGYILPQQSALMKSDAAIHELIGSILYRARRLNP